MAIAERVGVDPERAWLGAATALAAVLVAGSVAFPRAVYDRFVWQYFWGPVQADANAAACAVRTATGVSYLGSVDACRTAVGVVAYPGYTVVSEVGYALLLLLGVGGVVLLVRRLEVADDPRFVVALLPFVFFGGALRVVEDATDAVGGEALVTYPLNTLLISPVIYVTVFAVTLAALLGSVALVRRGVDDHAERPLFAAGSALLLATLATLLWLAVDGRTGAFHPQVFVVVVLVATVSTLAVAEAVRRGYPSVFEGTGRVSYVVVWAHAIDGAANVVGLDWMPALGAGPNLVPKHPVNRAVVDVTGAVLPESVLAVTGDAWPFLLLKLVAATVVVAAFDGTIFEENPRYATLLLVAVVAVGLGPGTRDLLRATLGV